MIDVELEQPRDAWSDLAALDEQLLTLEAARSGKRRDFSPYVGRPLDWITDVLKVKTLWSKQQEMIDALETHDRVVFYGGVNLGKDYSAAAAAMYRVYVLGQQCLMTSATLRQVTTIQMRDVGNFKRRGNLPGKSQKLSLEVPGSGGILALTSQEGSKLSGHHHPQGVFIVISEAQAFDSDEALAGLMSCASSEGSKVLAVANPVTNAGWLARIAQPDSGWYVIQASCFDHPNIIEGREVIPGGVNQRYIDGVAKDFTRESAIYASRVLGAFPSMGAANSIFTREMFARANAKWIRGL